jgi:hypothetical protein
MGSRAAAALAATLLLSGYCVNAAHFSGSEGMIKDAVNDQQNPSADCSCSNCKCGDKKKPNFVFILVRLTVILAAYCNVLTRLQPGTTLVCYCFVTSVSLTDVTFGK